MKYTIYKGKSQSVLKQGTLNHKTPQPALDSCRDMLIKSKSVKEGSTNRVILSTGGKEDKGIGVWYIKAAPKRGQAAPKTTKKAPAKKKTAAKRKTTKKAVSKAKTTRKTTAKKAA